MSSQSPVIDATPKEPVEDFKPIPADWKWKLGDVVQQKSECVILFDRENHQKFSIYFDTDWLSSFFTIRVAVPLSHDEFVKLVENAVVEFAKSNAHSFANDSDETRKMIVKGIYNRLFAHWYKKLSELNMLNVESFKQAVEKAKSNGNGNTRG